MAPLDYQGSSLTMLELLVITQQSQSACSEALRVFTCLPKKKWSEVLAITEQELQKKTAASEQTSSRPAR